MPFYEYECTACKFYVEALQKISEPPLRKCPSCKKQRLKKLVSAPVFRLKGAGWYETDFKSDQEQKRNLVGSEEGSERGGPKEDGKAAVAEAKDSGGTGTGTDTRGAADAKPAASAGSGGAAAGKRGQKSAAGAAPRRSSRPAVSVPRAAAAAKPAAKPSRASRPAARPAAKKKTAAKKSR